MSLEQPGVFYFDGPDSEVLELFKYGNWSSVTAEQRAQLSPALKKKLRQLTLIEMAINTKSLGYEHVGQVLGLKHEQVEPFLVEALLERAIVGRVNATAQLVYIQSVATRNTSPEKTRQATEMLGAFMNRIESLFTSNMQKLEADKAAERSLKRSHARSEL